MKYIFKNLVSFTKSEAMIFTLVIICIITSSFIINFSYGLYQNYNVVKVEEDSDLTEILITINNPELVTKEKIRECAFSITKETNNNISMYYVSPIIEPFYTKELEGYGWGGFDIRFTVKNNNIYPCEMFSENLKKNGNLINGEYFTPEQEMNGSLVAIVREVNTFDLDFDCTTNITTRVEGDERWVKIQDKEYKVIGYHTQGALPYIPFESLDNETQFKGIIGLDFIKSITRPQYNDIRLHFENTFGSAVSFPDLDIPEAENYYLYNTIIMISILIAALAAINFAILYKYILSKRTKMLTIFRICGCTKVKVLTMFLSECMLIAIPLFAATTVIYDRIVLPKLGQHFEYIESAYSIKLYLLIFCIYIAATLIVLLFMISGFLRKTIREAKEEK